MSTASATPSEGFSSRATRTSGGSLYSNRLTLNHLFNDDDDDDDEQGEAMSVVHPSGLSDVPEEGSVSGRATPSAAGVASNSSTATTTPTLTQRELANGNPRLPYSNAAHQATASTSTFNAGGMLGTPRSQSLAVPKKPSSLRPSSERSVRSGSGGHAYSPSIQVTSPSGRKSAASNFTKEGKLSKGREQKLRLIPRLPHSNDVELAPATNMYWSRAPVHGVLPSRNMRAHSATLVDSVAWLFGGCDDQGCWSDVYCFDIETMQWSHPEMQGVIPPPCRAHTATLVDRKMVIFGGGEGPSYYNTTYVLDTITRRWMQPSFRNMANPDKPVNLPAPRRAHTAVLYQNKIWVFGGGNGHEALNDVWTLDVGVPIDRMKWEEVPTKGRRPKCRGYHTANLVGSVMVVIGGSDGNECFSDVWCLNLDTLVWTQVPLQESHQRLSHTATQVGSYLFVAGGHDGSTYISDLLLYNLVSLQYEPRQVCGKPPSPRAYHAAIIGDSRLFVFGGFNGHDVFSDVHILDLAGAAYLPQVMSFKIDV